MSVGNRKRWEAALAAEILPPLPLIVPEKKEHSSLADEFGVEAEMFVKPAAA